MNSQPPSEPLTGPRSAAMPWIWRLFWTLAFLGPAGYSIGQGDYVMSAVFVVAWVAASGGYRVGAVRIAAAIGGLAAAIAYAPLLGIQHEWRLTEWFGTTGLLNRLLAIAATGILISLAVILASRMIAEPWLRRHPHWDRSNRWLGFGIGTAEGLLALLLLLGGVLVLEPTVRERSGDSGSASANLPDGWNERLSAWILATAEHTRRSSVGPLVERFNPLARYPALNKVEEIRQSVVVLSDPGRIERLIEHPELKKLRQREEVQVAYERVMQDPRIRSALHSGQRMTKSTALLLLNHPAVLDLIEQPGFVAAARQIIADSPLAIAHPGF